VEHSISDIPSLWPWSHCVHINFGESDCFFAARKQDISVFGANIPATSDGLVIEEVTESTSAAMASRPRNSTADQVRMSPTQGDDQTHLKGDSSTDVVQGSQP
jgi:hypothetical protein